MHKYTEEQKAFIKENVKGIGNVELTKMFNDRFNLNLTMSQIRGFKKNYKLNSGLDGRFVKGGVSFNKGKKGLQTANSTSFKKGRRPHNYYEVGTERVNGSNYVDVKIAHPNVWKGKHILVWEQHNGKVPKDHAIIFGDRNNRNFDIDNLILVTKSELSIMNMNKLIYDNADLTRMGAVVAKIYSTMSKINKQKSGG